MWGDVDRGRSCRERCRKRVELKRRELDRGAGRDVEIETRFLINDSFYNYGGDRSFRAVAPWLWNVLPPCLWCATSAEAFRKQLKTAIQAGFLLVKGFLWLFVMFSIQNVLVSSFVVLYFMAPLTDKNHKALHNKEALCDFYL